MRWFVNFTSKYKKPLLALLIAINILALIGVLQINISSSFDIFVPTESEYKDNMDYMNANFESSDSLIVMIEFNSDSLEVNDLTRLISLQNYLQNQEEILMVSGPAPENLIINGSPIEISEITEKEITLIDSYYSNLGKLSPVVYLNNKTYGIFQIFVSENFKNSTLDEIEDYLQDENYMYSLAGDIYMQNKILNYLILILTIIPPLALFLVLLVFNIRIKSIKGTLMSVLPAGIGALWTLGAIGWFGSEVSIITILAPIFTIVIGSADGLHFVTHVQESRKEGKGTLESIAVTLKMVGIPMIITTVTSIAGFVALLALKSDSIRSLVLFASLGITFAGIATWYVLPVILSGKIDISTRKTKERKDLLNIKKLWGLPSVIIVVVLIAVTGIGYMSIQTEFNQLMVYKKSTDVNKNFEKIMEVNNGSVPVFLTVKTNDSPITPANALLVTDLQKELEKQEYVGKTISIFDVMSAMNTTGIEGNAAKYMDFASLGNLINIDQNIIRVMIFPTRFKNDVLDGIEDSITQFFKDSPGYDIKITGAGYLMRDLTNSMVASQGKSLFIAFALIIALLYISLRKVVPALLTTVPIAITVIVLYGFLGLSGISLNVFTVTIFSITIGVGIDYAVHFTSIFMEYKKLGFTREESVNKAYKYTSKPIIANAMGISIGMSALFVSPLQIHTNVAILMWVSMICGVLLSLSFLPTLLRGRRVKSRTDGN
ncbi:MAG: MMPL family transporter [Clostridiales bacterium]|nr:MMPL family transporter [Clostridiales bacterium]